MSQEIIKRYSQAFKQQVVREYEAGASIYQLRQKYGIGGSNTIQGWVSQYGRAGLRSEMVVIRRAEEQPVVKALQERVSELEAALAESVLDNRLLTTTLEVASQALGIDLKKNFGKKS